MKETFIRSLWAIFVCLMCLVLAVLITTSMMFHTRYSADQITEFSPSANIVAVEGL